VEKAAPRAEITAGYLKGHVFCFSEQVLRVSFTKTAARVKRVTLGSSLGFGC